jgi:hypothetical protein
MAQQLDLEQTTLCTRYNLVGTACNQDKINEEILKERCRKVGLQSHQCTEENASLRENNLPERCDFYQLYNQNVLDSLTETLNNRYRLYIQSDKRNLISEPNSNLEQLKIKYQLEEDTTKKKEIEDKYVNDKINLLKGYMSCSKENADYVANKCTSYQISAVTGLPCNIVSVFDTLDKCMSFGIPEKDCNIYLLEEMKSNEEFQQIMDLADDTINENIRVLTSERELVQKEFESRKQNFEKYSQAVETIQRKLFSEVTRKMITANEKVEQQILEIKRQKRLEFISDIKGNFIYIISGFLILILIFVIS